MTERKDLVYATLLMMVGILFVTFFSRTTSPLYNSLSDLTDSAIFQIIGKYWLEGAIPYKDLWDLKGPFIFFINAIGHWLTGNRYGVWLLQMVMLILTLASTFKTFRLYFNGTKSFCLILLSLAGLAYVYQGGNMTAEYLLPFLSLSFYGILKWNRQISECAVISHQPSYAIIYGMVLGISLISRLTNALAVFGAVTVIASTLLWNKEWRNLLLNIAGFLLQDFHNGRNPLIGEQIRSTFKDKRPQWILLYRHEGTTPCIQPLLDSAYTVVASDLKTHLTLYTLKT